MSLGLTKSLSQLRTFHALSQQLFIPLHRPNGSTSLHYQIREKAVQRLEKLTQAMRKGKQVHIMAERPPEALQATSK
jgi:hypothetical protein